MKKVRIRLVLYSHGILVCISLEREPGVCLTVKVQSKKDNSYLQYIEPVGIYLLIQ